jgi:hypothetical protein
MLLFTLPIVVALPIAIPEAPKVVELLEFKFFRETVL